MTSSVPSLRQLSKFALTGAQVLLGSGDVAQAGDPVSCTNTQLSCQNTSAVADLCCFAYPGGMLLQTQFWDTDPTTGPTDSWTIHGLWPDHCDGTYDASCDPSRAYSDISGILTDFGYDDTLSYMETYWKNNDGTDEYLWEHEWSKHGTCINTLDTDCFTDYEAKQEVPVFFNRTVELFKTLPTYEWLEAAGITPSSSKTYQASAIQSALSSQHGNTVYLGCSDGELSQVYYYFNVKGSVATGEFVSAEPDGGDSSTCSGAVSYLPKSGGSSTSTTATATKTSATATATSTGTFSGKGYLNVVVDGSTDGCIISKGTWYTTGTCATFTAADSGDGFTLSSSKGDCAVSDGEFTCGSSVRDATVFTALDGDLAYDGSTAWYADSVPSGSTQATVYSEEKSTEFVITWGSK
ncbi:ribonuclease M [Saccharata proteae CBS 121410]|uniref:Ribonuclease T2-like n=1 Tax=Saccharata proteae CBS 121410 TaxID=1314787 RepID=A0A9P4HSX7_9PEZI|nr:ribonuclease M [Saccharata proteae CBS 121410]